MLKVYTRSRALAYREEVRIYARNSDLIASVNEAESSTRRDIMEERLMSHGRSILRSLITKCVK